ncbi:MAG: nucleotidyltransferase domain-containing protein [Chloroflexi bacterium]|nr:nucleotidyltransferase domain-containing protein [Chloroflexota bacterium]
MFSVAEREALRDRLIAAARGDDRITAAAVVGSGADDGEDAWSDIDLALRIADGFKPDDVAAEWTTLVYQSAGAIDHVDVWSGSTLFRVFLLRSSLQVDLSFWPGDAFAASGASFRLLFGESNRARPARSPSSDTLIGMGWLYALHARSSIARGRALQALYMINSLREQVVMLACLRHELPAYEGRGVDDLPVGLRQFLAETLVRDLNPHELRRAFTASVDALLDEAQRVDPAREQRLRETVWELVHTAD